MPNGTDSQSLEHFQEKCHWYNIPKKLIDDIITLDFQNAKSKDDICLMVQTLNMMLDQSSEDCVKYGAIKNFGKINTTKTGSVIDLGEIFSKVFDGTYENNGLIGTRQLEQKHIAKLSLLYLNNYENEEIDKNLGYLMFSLAVEDDSNSQIIVWCLLAILEKCAEGKIEEESLPAWLPISFISTSNISTFKKIINSLTPIAERFPNFFFKKSKFENFWEMVKDDSQVMEFEDADNLKESLFAKLLGLIDAPIFNGELETIQYIITISCGIFDSMNTSVNKQFLNQLLQKFLDILDRTNSEKIICDVLKSTEKVLAALSYHKYDDTTVTEHLIRIAEKNTGIVKYCLREDFQLISDIFSKIPTNFTEIERLGKDLTELNMASNREDTKIIIDLRKYLYQLSIAKDCIPDASSSAKKLMIDLKSEDLEKFEQFITLYQDTLNLIIRKHHLTWLFLNLLPYPEVLALDIRIQYYHEAMDQNATLDLLSECLEQYQVSAKELRRMIADAVVKLSVNVDNDDNQFYDVAKIHRATINEILRESVGCQKSGEFCSICLKYPNFVGNDVKRLYAECGLIQLPLDEVEKIFEGIVDCLTKWPNEQTILQTLPSVNRFLKISGTSTSEASKRKIIQCAARNKTIFNNFFRNAGSHIHLLELLINEANIIDFDIKIDNITAISVDTKRIFFEKFALECLQYLYKNQIKDDKVNKVLFSMIESFSENDNKFQQFFENHKVLINRLLRQRFRLELFVLSLRCLVHMDRDIKTTYLDKSYTFYPQDRLFLLDGILSHFCNSPTNETVAELLPIVEHSFATWYPELLNQLHPKLFDSAVRSSKILDEILHGNKVSFQTGAILKVLTNVFQNSSPDVKIAHVDKLVRVLDDNELIKVLSQCLSRINLQSDSPVSPELKATVKRLTDVLTDNKMIHKIVMKYYQFAKNNQGTITYLLKNYDTDFGSKLFKLIAPFPEYYDFDIKIKYLRHFLSINKEELHWELLEECLERYAQQPTTTILEAMNEILWSIKVKKSVNNRWDFARKHKNVLNEILAKKSVAAYDSITDFLAYFPNLITFDNKVKYLPAVLGRIDEKTQWELLDECVQRFIEQPTFNVLEPMTEILENVMSTATWRSTRYRSDFAYKHRNVLNDILAAGSDSSTGKFLTHFPQFMTIEHKVKHLSVVLENNDAKSHWDLLVECMERHIQQSTSNMLKPMNEILRHALNGNSIKTHWLFAETYKDTLNDILASEQHNTCSSIIEYFAFFPEYMTFDNKVKHLPVVVKRIDGSALAYFLSQCLETLRNAFADVDIQKISAAVKFGITHFPIGSAEKLDDLTENNAIELRNVVELVGSDESPAWRLILTKLGILDFASKVKVLREHLLMERTGHVRITINRDSIFADSFSTMSAEPLETWKNGFIIKFGNENGVDAGGLKREWFTILTREIFNPNYALFTTASDDNNSYTINKASHVNPEHLDYFKFVGRFIGKSIMEKQFVDCPFTKSLYKHILNIPVGFKDFESDDPIFCNSLKALLNNPISELGLDLTFSTDVEEFGVVSQKELKTNGRHIEVTDENKEEYVRLLCQMKMTGSIQKQLEHFLSGFYDIIPKHLITVFSVKELELLICGEPDIDIDHLEANSTYERYQKSDTTIQWFWQAVKSFDKNDKARLLMFVTGSAKAPPGGFASNPEKAFVIAKSGAGSNRLPTAHTCADKLVLPQYDSYENLRKSVLTAIRECSEGFEFY